MRPSFSSTWHARVAGHRGGSQGGGMGLINHRGDGTIAWFDKHAIDDDQCTNASSREAPPSH